MSEVRFRKCDGCGRKAEGDEAKRWIGLGIWNPDKQPVRSYELFESLLGSRTAVEPGGPETYEFCSARCVVTAMVAQAALEAQSAQISRSTG